MAWSGRRREFKTQVRTDVRVAGGYLSARNTKVYDEARIESREVCTDGQWRQSDQKVIDVAKLAAEQ